MSREQFKVIPPLSLVEITKVTLDESAWKDHLGRVFRIGYDSKQDGLGCDGSVMTLENTAKQ